MPKYEVMLEGKNFPVFVDGKTEVLGFFVTRKVKAVSEKEAELKAVAMVRGDKKLISTLDTSHDAKPKIYLDNINQLSWWSLLGGSGYIFYPMECE